MQSIKNILTQRNGLQILNKSGIIEWIYNQSNFKTKKEEDAWGKTFSNNKQWTTFVGEKILEDILILLEKNPKKVDIINSKKSINGKKLMPDFVCDDAFYENKARTYNTSGTAGEKVLMSAYKYSECYSLYKKPVYIVCMAYQEIEADHDFMLFNPVLECHKNIIETFKKNNVFFVKATELLDSYIQQFGTFAPLPIVSKNTKPVIKWAGGKRQIMQQIIKHFPQKFNNYHEPFVGGMSVFLEIVNSGFEFNKAFLSDKLQVLINMYDVIKNNKEEFLQESKRNIYTNNLDNFTEIKIEFNKMKKNITNDNNIKLAVMMMYLNKIGFNGMYRENGSGEYNIPFGKQKNPTIFNIQNIDNLHSILKNENVFIKNCDFSDVLLNVQSKDFIYLDPPYHSTFSSYTKDKFDENQHIKLKEMIDTLSQKDCFVILSNSDTEFIRELYKDYSITEIPMKRMINSNPEKRKNISNELLISNFTPK